MNGFRRNRFDAETYDEGQGFVAAYGQELVDVLDPQAGERILDLGCGTGHHMAEMARRGADVFGIDASPSMIARAEELYPELSVRCVDAGAFEPEETFDAVFSNATLHWIHDQDRVLSRVAAALRPEGRFVAELGAHGNVAPVTEAMKAEARARGMDTALPWYFPRLGEYAGRVETHGLDVWSARLFDRMTVLEGSAGLRSWLQQFGDSWLARFGNERDAVVEAIERHMMPTAYDSSTNQWTLPYRRLRLWAVRR